MLQGLGGLTAGRLVEFSVMERGGPRRDLAVPGQVDTAKPAMDGRGPTGHKGSARDW